MTDDELKAMNDAREKCSWANQTNARNSFIFGFEAGLAHARALLAAGASEGQAEPSTPAAQWRVQGHIDPHAGRYDGERATLTLGTLTDDELANGVFMYGNEPLDLRRALDCDPDYHPPIVWLTGAKERIRWLSRALVKETAKPSESGELLKFLDGCAGEGLVINGIDAADLYVKLFPAEYAEAIAQETKP